MTIEQKAKAYDEALEKAIALYKVAEPMSGCNVLLETVFPELKESKDDRIRKALIKYFSEGREYLSLIPYNKEECVAWLEKQGEQPQYWKPSEEQLEALDYAYNSCPDTERGNYYEGVLETIIDDLHKLFEKQGEQKPFDYENANIQQKDYAPKVEPKFRNGVWVTNSIETLQITGYDIDYGYQVDYKGNLQHRDTDIVEKEYHLWTIQDAKDGDVLYLQHDGKEHIIIYKGVIKERFRTFVSAYCAYNGIVDAFCFADVSRYTDIADGGIMPATKEQRNFLFQKMREEGYEWDAEKKELKKIEQSIEIPFGAKDSELQEASYYIPKGYHAEIDGDKVVIKKGEQKPIETRTIGYWNVQEMITPEESLGISSEEWNKIVDDSIYGEPRTAWSEEDEKNLQGIIDEIEANKNNAPDYDLATYDRFLDWLKSLKDRYTWKPSDEQMEALKLSTYCQDKQMSKVLFELYQDLKKLREE